MKKNLGSLSAWKKVLFAIGGGVVLVFAFLLVAGFFRDKIEPGDPSTPSAAPPQDRIVAAKQIEEAVVERFPGSVAAVRDAVISARIVARVEQVLVLPGERVAEGDDLAVLDSRDLESRYLQIQEELAGAKARLTEAKSFYERMQQTTEGAVSRAQIDSAKAAFEGATSTLQRATQRLEEARVAVSYATVEAPFDAIVIDRYAEPGDLASPGRALLKIYDPTQMRLEAWVRESTAIGLKSGGQVRVALESLGEEVDGRVEEIVPQAEAGSRSFLVKVALPARDNLFPGMFGRLLVEGDTVPRVVLPGEAIARVGQLAFVTLADGRGTRRLIVPGLSRADGMVEILSGIAADESVVLPSGGGVR